MEIIKKLENEYINLKEHFNTRKKELYSYLYAKFLINEDSINELVKYSSLKENIIFNKNKKNDSEYSAGLYAGAEKQAINTVNKIISEYMKIHIKKARLDNIDLKDLINCLDFIVLINKANDFISKYTQKNEYNSCSSGNKNWVLHSASYINLCSTVSSSQSLLLGLWTITACWGLIFLIKFRVFSKVSCNE